MNQRITELMLEAGRTIPGDKHIDADFCEKFAELIVQDVFDCIAAERFEVYEPVIQKVKHHFGVEE